MPIAEWLLLRRVIDDETGCWEWPGARTRGYGMIRVNNRNRMVHRLAYELWVGAIPSGLLVCHRCDNPPCYNPAHLFTGTDADNARDMWNKGRGYRHALDPGARRIARGEENGRAVITAETAAAIAAAEGSALRVAARFGVSRALVEHIRYGWAWAHATGVTPRPRGPRRPRPAGPRDGG